MSFALTVIVLGHAFFNSIPNTFADQSTFITPSVLITPQSTRRPGYTYTPGIGAHKVITQLVDWNTARKKCEEDGSHLVIINSVAEAEAVVSLFNSTHSRTSHVGVHDLYHEGEFVTIHGDALIRTGFTEWNIGQPSKIKTGANQTENCVEIGSNAKLNDIPCTDYYTHFVCESPRVEP